MTKQELEKQVKELKELVRELRNGLKKHAPKEEELTESSFCAIFKDKEYWHFELKLNPDNDEIMIVSKKKLNTNDYAVAYHRELKQLMWQLQGKQNKRANERL